MKGQKTRYFLELSFLGTNYHGWQVQPNAISVQEVLNDKISVILKEAISIVGAGRTDTGVHAKQIYAHFDCSTEIESLSDFKFHLNNFLPEDIAIHDVFKVESDHHTRFDATARTYEYLIHRSKNPFLTNSSYYYKHDLDIELMNKAASLLIGTKDFSCFSRSKTQTKTNICSITLAEWKETEDGFIFRVSADRFLRNMVRAIVGTLLNVGCSKIRIEEIENIIASKDRSQAGESAPAHGLYLTKVSYPKEIVNVQ